ncbi:MAG TPA: UDP-N-acetylglucosamine 2-epimerase (non-hydrolyzing) [Pyrinomonadaceae bacterium]|nr:UDP-N-acetylglucosamine 2-epimerase (non-hydrolyzing) [Pyrinomonadaceae bacterium]
MHVVGARPNFVKLSPVMRALSAHPLKQLLVHTGQHYDHEMSEIFFQQLKLPQPDFHLRVGPGTPTEQTARIMIALEKTIRNAQPDLVIVYGDVTSSLAAALVCSKNSIRLAHVEAGLRSNDRTMPEEINRLLIDRVADILFAPIEEARKNLIREGVHRGQIHVVGNVAIDTLVQHLHEIPSPDIGLPDRYMLVTLHRPSNADNNSFLKTFLQALDELSDQMAIVFPVHPRIRERIEKLRHREVLSKIKFTGPLGYLQFLALEKNAHVVLTDSGGVQAETTFLRVPCIILRNRTEVSSGKRVDANSVVGQTVPQLKKAVQRILAGDWKMPSVPKFWDGEAATRIADTITKQV